MFLRKQKKVPRVLKENEQDITNHEMLRVIKEASNNKAAGRDDISYEFIKNLGPIAQGALLDLYQRVWIGKDIPNCWKMPAIKTMLKEGKDPQIPAS